MRLDEQYGLEIADQALMIKERYKPHMSKDNALLARKNDLKREVEKYTQSLDPSIKLR